MKVYSKGTKMKVTEFRNEVLLSAKSTLFFKVLLLLHIDFMWLEEEENPFLWVKSLDPVLIC